MSSRSAKLPRLPERSGGKARSRAKQQEQVRWMDGIHTHSSSTDRQHKQKKRLFDERASASERVRLI